MNTALIAEYVSATTLKSLNNRVSAALEKDGTPAQLLRGASQSLKALQAKTSDETEQMFIGIYADVFEIGAELAKRGKEAEPKAQAPKQPRENWVDEDSEEGQEIIAKAKAKREAKAPKPQRKPRAILNEMSKSEMADLITALLAQAK